MPNVDDKNYLENVAQIQLDCEYNLIKWGTGSLLAMKMIEMPISNQLIVFLDYLF